MKSVEYLIGIANKSGFYFTKEEIEKTKELFVEETKLFSKGTRISCGNLEAIVERDSRIITDVTYTHNYHQDTISNDGWETTKSKELTDGTA